MKRTLILLSLLLSLPGWSFSEDDFQMRVSWIKELKVLFTHLEQKEAEQLLTQREKTFLQNFQLIQEAWADARYECFFAGWPSTLVASGGKRLCQNPLRGNHEYSAGKCKASELQCQPLLFGEGLCVSFQHKADKQRAFSKCEEKFQKEKKGSYDFLKSLSRDDAQNLRELSLLAGEICQKGSVGVQKTSGMCRSLMKKLQHGLHSIDQAWRESSAVKVEREQKQKSKTSVVAHTHKDPEECEELHPELQGVVEQVQVLSETVKSADDELYDQIKQEFQASAFCDPEKILNDPSDRPNALVMHRLLKDINFMDHRNTDHGAAYDRLAQRYGFSAETSSKVKAALAELKTKTFGGLEWRHFKGQAQVLMLQDFSRQQPRRHSFDEDDLKSELAGLNIFSEDDEGNIDCPFVGKDAFLKALAGQRKLASNKEIKNKNQLTIVDYTRPSNERRMFVIDLNSKKVLHNTWTAHGGGNNQGPGEDGLGSNPQVSNVSGSNLSSDGFIIATQASYGPLFGNNVLLKGIDENNTNMARRAVVLHGWQSPMAGYTEGVRDYNYQTETYSDPLDALKEIQKIDLQSADFKVMEKAVNRLRTATTVTKYLAPTEGCLGVPTTPVPQLDRKGRSKSQLELLREDLPGSLIFNYSGPQMQSKYF